MTSTAEDADWSALPPPSAQQKQRGWMRDYAAVWAEHDSKLKALAAAADLDAFRLDSRPDADHPSIRQFDFTGGARVRRAKEQARKDELDREDARLRAWRAKQNI